MDTVVDLINKSDKTAFSFEILPPLKGNNIEKVYNIIDKLIEFDPKYINITTHHSEYMDKEMPDGTVKRVNIRKRPGSVAIAASIQHKYDVMAIPHMICKGFSREETEYALMDLNFLHVCNLLLLRGDTKRLAPEQIYPNINEYATDLQTQVNNFNMGIAADGSEFERNATPFAYGMACYPEVHEDAVSAESDIQYMKQKADNGAEYFVTQMFFDNQKYFSFVEKCRKEGITQPIIPGVKPIVLMNQLEVLPRIFRSSIPEELASELRKCKTDEEAKEVGVEWGIKQCKELITYGVPSIHFYSLMATDSIRKIAKEIY
ncbi:methylenetetrahydrofolate reductase (NADPH) [Dysgonomonas sp. PFB1-18]|uniref:methylenetetrahydrofolate reductase n=1 Tax=unclassified Dysgonomonas TaxID=2630389 RepID=UPI002474B835|nr:MULTISPECIES: methylenetetrahydrofolate reductase [unclassified Dysgonomonas]MDH6309868.1 methylenetetrahydrofolate reductase (NADPH) [Dysgonomonas sp. PF1-14]MDH6339412.1 methylenetetrahydrofolate reductase (NADPH) [Dysgonomonas sp. PF1-16]MDH6380911.1 methylenetetrahydrofolate reductase (NADPH) [Dysgonomonas sp. PFB1-18]MDH6397920.1 methylenetetrahydrofolate reductase (NADPH) [Dysgonomonas sp. PF1-23]